jgi:pimeloyl-ACP methyl ester carboxylesterase
MRSIVEEGAGAPTGLHLVMLSGGFIAAEDFLRHGFVERLRERGIDCPVTLAEVRMAYFADASLRPRLASVLQSVRARGAQRVWIAGVSLGGLAALCQAAQDDHLAGLALLSPYPGTRPVLREIEAAGGLESWAAGAPATPEDLEREAWLWLARRAPGSPPVHAWYGSGDRFAAGQRQLAKALPGENVHEIAGGHDWPDWRRMWDRFLETDSLR